MKPIIAKLPAKPAHRGENYGGEKEFLSAWDVVAFRDGEYFHPVTLRTYSGRPRNASRIYATIWVSHCAPAAFDGCSGSGYAGGYGYHKASAAAQDAIQSAGIELSAPIGGAGDSAIEAALGAIARALGFGHFTIVRN